MTGELRASLPAARTAVRLGVLVALVAGAVVIAPGTAAAAPTLTSGFVVQDLPSGQDELLTDFAYLPDGGWLTTGKNGRVARVAPSGEARTVAELPVVTTGDLGLVGIAVAPDGAVYTGRELDVDGQWTMRLSAWTLTDTALVDERVLFELPNGSDVHALTGLVADPDGSLWVSIGDSGDFRAMDPIALRALDTTTGYGKLLHVLPDGSGVPDNPFYDAAAPASWQSRVYASGFRSPFRFSLDPGTGGPILGDVGWGTWEEVDVVQRGASYGWPCWEGEVATPGYTGLPGCQGQANTTPLWTYQHGAAGTSVTGGVVYTGSSYPAEYQGAYFFGDYASQRVYTLCHDDQGRLVRAPEADGFGAGNGVPVAFAAAPDNGDLVWADIRGNVLERLVYAPGNRPPTARATATVDAATRTVTFDGSASSEWDGEPLTLHWDFGDGTSGEGVTVQHTYADPGPVTARLTVTDPGGAEDSTTLPVVPGNSAPVLTLNPPPPGRRYVPGDLVEATAEATDAEDGPLTVRWTEVLVHCSGGLCHEHPGESFEGPAYSRPFVDHGEGTRMVVTAGATDSAGVEVRASFEALPVTAV